MAWAWTAVLACCVVPVGVAAEARQSPASVFRDMVVALRDLGPSRVESTQVLEASSDGRVQSSRPLESVYVFASDGNTGPRAVLRLKGYRVTVADEAVFVEHADMDDGYVRLPRTSQPVRTLRDAFRSLPDPLLVLKMSDADPARVPVDLDERGSGERLVPASIPTSVAGRRQVLLESPTSRLELVQEVETGHIIEAVLDHRGPPNAPEGVTIRSTWTYVWDALEPEEGEAAVEFHRRGRHRLDDVAALRAPLSAQDDGSGRSGAAPPLGLETLDGEMVRLSKLTGRVVVLDFWATWCGPCRRSLPAMQELAEEYEREQAKVEFLAVNVMERGDPGTLTERIRRFMTSRELDLTVLMDRTGVAAKAWNIDAIPVTVVVDSEGMIVGRFRGFQSGSIEELRRTIDALLVEPDGSIRDERP
ncbi:MAG: TlpA disulfide reductase family protein [Phycisphaerales bacterium]|nr:TlpA disulfide reductase family protein [Phycisphaerales bacterium]